VLKSNKFIMSKHGQFVGKGYDCGGLFRLSLAEFCNKSMNHICGNISDGGIDQGSLTGPTYIKQGPADLLGEGRDGSLRHAGSCLHC